MEARVAMPAADSRPDISIVIAAYNAARTLPRACDSVLAQSYPHDRMQLIIVDDCSDDGTFQIAQSYAGSHGGVTVLSTKRQSGSPSEPRNIGLAHASGEYVFFLDADDWLGAQAVERMLGHAREWGSDVLLVKLRGEGGRAVPRSMFKRNQPRANVYHSHVMWSFGPYKLYRRSLVEDLRFPPFMPEDISFVLRAYVLADTVSVAADYDYYHLALVEGGRSNISLSSWDDVESNLEAYADVFGFAAARISRFNRSGTFTRRLFKRDICNTLRTIAREPDIAKAQDQLLRLARIVKPFYKPWLLASLPKEDRALLKAAFARL